MSLDLTTNTAVETLSNEVINVASNVISAQAVSTDNSLYLWIVVPLLTVFLTTQYSTIRDSFYKNQFQSPIRPFIMAIYMGVLDIMMAAAITINIWSFRNPATGIASDLYISTACLWFIIQGIKALWSLFFWTYGAHKVAICFSLAFIVIMDLLCFILTGLFFGQTSNMGYVSGALTLIVSLAYIALIVFNALMLWRFPRRSTLRRSEQDESMIKTGHRRQQQRSRPQQQQQQSYYPPPQDYENGQYKAHSK